MNIFLLLCKCTVSKYQGSLNCSSMIVLLVYNINVGQILKEWYCINTENIVIVIQSVSKNDVF